MEGGQGSLRPLAACLQGDLSVLGPSHAASQGWAGGGESLLLLQPLSPLLKSQDPGTDRVPSTDREAGLALSEKT